MEVTAILEAFAEACPGETFEAHTIPVAETVVAVPAACLQEVVSVLDSTFSISHLSTITGQDRGEALELLYHFWSGARGLTLRVTLPRDAARVISLTELIPGASFYEREIAEMLDVSFAGHPHLEHFLLPEDWEEGAPLRQEPPGQDEIEEEA